MISLGLSASDRAALQTALITPNRVKVRLEVLDLTGGHLSDISSYVADGQVDGTAGDGVTRQLTVTLDDPYQRLPFDSDDPADTALFMDRMLRASYEVLVNGDYVSVPVFTGPVTGLARNGAEVSVQAASKEILFLGAAWQPITFAKGMKKTDALSQILTRANPAYAEPARFLFLPDLPNKLPHAVSLTRDSVPWAHALQMARAVDRQLFYNGRGEVHARHPTSGRPVFTFRGTQHVTSPVQITYSAATVNAVRVLGAIPKGAKQHVVGIAVAPAGHLLSPARMGRYLMPGGQIVADDKIKTKAEANARAARLLEDGLREGVDVSFESVPIPLLDLGDLVHVASDDASVVFRVNSFSLPLVVGASAAMTVGTHRNVQLRVRHHAHHHKPRHPHKHRHRTSR